MEHLNTQATALLTRLLSAVNNVKANQKIESFILSPDQLEPASAFLTLANVSNTEATGVFSKLQLRAQELSKEERDLRIKVLDFIKKSLSSFMANDEIQAQLTSLLGPNSKDAQLMGIRIIDLHINECKNIDSSVIDYVVNAPTNIKLGLIVSVFLILLLIVTYFKFSRKRKTIPSPSYGYTSLPTVQPPAQLFQ